MPDTSPTSKDAVLRSRMRQHPLRSPTQRTYSYITDIRPSTRVSSQYIRPSKTPHNTALRPTKTTQISSLHFKEQPRQQTAHTITRPSATPIKPLQPLARPPHKWKSYTLFGMALVVFVLGIVVSISGWHTNRAANAVVSHLAKEAASTNTNDSATVPSTVKPSTSDFLNYTVGATFPRYLRIPKLGVQARILQLGVDKDGELATPSNVYDTGWYDASSLPGQSGAMLIDGHVSSWTTNGVFYGLKKLVSGDTLSVQRGDGTTFTYKVVKTQAYDANNVDMQAAVTPVIPGKPGLNLITCTGTVKLGTSDFTQRLIVFTVQV